MCRFTVGPASAMQCWAALSTARQARRQAWRTSRTSSSAAGSLAVLPRPVRGCASAKHRHCNCCSQASFCQLRREECVDENVQPHCRATCGICSNVSTGAGRARLGLWLAYLNSYEHMGRASVRCAGSCACMAEIDGHNQLSRTSVTAVQRVEVVRSTSAVGSVRRHACRYLTICILMSWARATLIC